MYLYRNKTTKHYKSITITIETFILYFYNSHDVICIGILSFPKQISYYNDTIINIIIDMYMLHSIGLYIEFV